MPKLAVAANPPLAPPFLTPAKLHVQAALEAQVVRNGATIAVMADKSAPRLLPPQSHSIQFPSSVPMPNLQAGIEGFVTPGGVIQPSQLFQPTISLTTPPLRVVVPHIRTPEVFAPVDIGPAKPTEDRMGSAAPVNDRPFETNPTSPPLGTPHPPPTGSGYPTPDLPRVPIPDCFRYPLSDGCRQEYSPPEDVPDDVPAPTPEPVRIREGCTIRLGAEVTNSRDDPHWWLTPRARDFESWMAQTLDLVSATWGLVDAGTFPRIRAMNPDFVGYLMCMPSGLTFAPLMHFHWNEIDKTRYNTAFLSTNDPLEDWAIRVDNGPPPPRGVRRLDFLPMLNQSDEGGHVVDLGFRQRPSGIPADDRELRLFCRPKAFALDPERGRSSLLRAMRDTCILYGADGVRLDEMTLSYASGPKSPAQCVRLDSAEGADCTLPGVGAAADRVTAYAIQLGTGNFSASPYVDLHPDVCAGRDADADARAECQQILQRSLMNTLGAIGRDPTFTSVTGRRLTVWSNLHAALFATWNHEKFQPADAIATAPFRDRYGGLLGSEREVLRAGGWFEEFAVKSDQEVRSDPEIPDGSDEARFPAGVLLNPMADGQGVVTADGTLKRIHIHHPDYPDDEHLCIYRTKTHIQRNWRAQMKWFRATGRWGGRARADVPVTSVDDFQRAAASYLLCRAGGPDDLALWPAVPEGAGVPAQGQPALAYPTLTLFPKFIYPRSSGGVLRCNSAPDAPQGAITCELVGARAALVDENGDKPFIDDDRLSPQKPSFAHPLILQATLGGRSREPGGATGMTALRLLLDVKLGKVVGYGRQGPLYVARYEHGLAVFLPLADTGDVSDADVVSYRYAAMGAHRYFYFAVDTAAVDALVAGGAAAKVRLTRRIPDWAVQPPGPDDQAFFPAVVRRVLESGLQSVERDAVLGRTGTPGICLRWVDQQSPNVPMLPGMGKILIDADSDAGREILAYFPTEAFGPRRRTVGSVLEFLGQPRPDVQIQQGTAAGRFQGGL